MLINKYVLQDDTALSEGERDALQKALAWLLLNPDSSQQVRSVIIKIQASLGDQCPPLEAGLRAQLAAPAPATPATLQLLEFLSDHPLGRRLLLDSLPQLMLFFKEELGFHCQTMCAMVSPVELAAAAGPGQRAVRLLVVTLQVLQPLSPEYDLETVRAARDSLERLLTLPALPWDLRGNCGMAYVLLCLAGGDRDLHATVLNAAFPSAELCGSDAGPVPLADWPLAAQLALLAGCVHALPSDQLLLPAGGGGALLSLLLGWLLHTGMSVSDTATLLGFSRGVLSALGRITEACRGGLASPGPPDPSAPLPGPSSASAELSSAVGDSPSGTDASPTFPDLTPDGPADPPDGPVGSPASLASLLPEVLVEDLLQFVWRLMADDAQSVRSVAGDMLSALVALFAGFPDGPFLRELTTSVLALPLHLRRRCRALRCLLPALGVTRLLAACPALPRQLVGVIGDPAVSTHAVELYCVLLSEHRRAADPDTWLSVWVEPLFESDAVPPPALAQITGRIAQLAPGSAAYVTQRVACRRRLPRHLWLVLLTAVQAAHRQAAPGENWRDALPVARLREALQHRDDQVGIAEDGDRCIEGK
ncbi:Thyroid adenoma-associated [Amphibalanus amphitrite]|uniref:Thyroid adenoma-associated n=2 Tax=Amphibalanus amphitrite TaxID=1232801 RepID=A0A6A4VU58_AMPAM|nr:Thyroid adenoma-associated [Amphibalanus amphitrite]